MKVLFAVSNENISAQIVKKYQKVYKEIISYKNVYYFNAIVKELQRDKSYDRIVISEDLEPFANNNFDAIEKFIFEKLDNISDEATGLNGEDIPVILLATDKRVKSDPILLRLFGIGIYNVLLGQDRTTDNVCALLNKPRGKKEAKMYYKIEAEEVNYKSENEDDVSEAEIKNILNHYKKLGKDEERYIESFNNIAAQYNDAQLRIITKFLPLNVKAVLEEKSPKYQSVMTFNSTSATELMKKKKEEEGLKVGFLNNTNTNKLTRPVIVPTAVKKVAKNNIDIPKTINNKIDTLEEINNEIEPEMLPGFDTVQDDDLFADFSTVTEEPKVLEEQEIETTVKRGRGRPRKIVNEESQKINLVKRGRGRPRKVVEEENVDEDILTDFTAPQNIQKEAVLPGFDDIEEQDSVLPGFDDIKEDSNDILPGFDDVEEQDSVLPGFDEIKEDSDDILPGFDTVEEQEGILPGFDKIEEEQENVLPGFDENHVEQNTNSSIKNISDLISKDKKVVSFVGTTKNGTSFLVNNLAKTLASNGIKTAILDLTSNRNAYYIYTKNEEKLRNIASNSIKKLNEGVINGISVNQYLDIYTALPGDKIPLENANEIVSLLAKNYSIVLMDCDFTTPADYFAIAQEIYIVQTMDILTIQPMTAFLRDLKAKEILDTEKVKIIINKFMNVSGLNAKMIIGGLAFYNDPSMSFMTELFNKDAVKYIAIPFDMDACSLYLEGVMDCEIKINRYPKKFNEKLKELANMVYPLLDNKGKNKSKYGAYEGTKFSESIDSTLEKMKNKY